jgi:hypothetical protein
MFKSESKYNLEINVREKESESLTTSGTYPWSFMTQIFHSGHSNHGGDRKTFEVVTST